MDFKAFLIFESGLLNSSVELKVWLKWFEAKLKPQYALLLEKNSLSKYYKSQPTPRSETLLVPTILGFNV
jgi:hypothetical protein